MHAAFKLGKEDWCFKHSIVFSFPKIPVSIFNLLQAVTLDLPEVLELVLSCADDAALLCKATTVSTYHKQLVLTRIQQHLPQLLVYAVKQAADTTAGLERQASRLMGLESSPLLCGDVQGGGLTSEYLETQGGSNIDWIHVHCNDHCEP